MYQWESVLCTNLFDASSVPNSLHLQNIHTYILLLHFSESSSISGKNMGSSIWSIVWLRHWNGAVSAFCQRQNANSFRKSEDLQPLLGLGAPPPHISHLVANQIQALSPFLNPAISEQVAKTLLFYASHTLVVEILCWPALRWNKYLEKFLVCNSSLGNLGCLKLWRWKKGV